MVRFEALFSALNKKKVRYLLAGGIAVNLYGIERATADIDIVVDLEEGNLKRFIAAVKELGFRPKVPVSLEDFINKENREKWIKEKGMMVFSLFDPKNQFFLLDVFVEIPFDFKTVYKKRRKIKAEKAIISVIPLETLIEMKEKTVRPQDIADVFYLRQIKEEQRNEK